MMAPRDIEMTLKGDDNHFKHSQNVQKFEPMIPAYNQGECHFAGCSSIPIGSSRNTKETRAWIGGEYMPRDPTLHKTDPASNLLLISRPLSESSVRCP